MTNESKLDNHNSSNFETKRTKFTRQNSSTSNSGILPKICIFCEKQSKFELTKVSRKQLLRKMIPNWFQCVQMNSFPKKQYNINRVTETIQGATIVLLSKTIYMILVLSVSMELIK